MSLHVGQLVLWRSNVTTEYDIYVSDCDDFGEEPANNGRICMPPEGLKCVIDMTEEL